MTTVIQLHLKGSPHEIGFQHGHALRTHILRQITFYQKMFQTRCHLNWAQVLEISREFEATLQRLSPDLLEEMRGIADGVNDPSVGILDIVALNSRSEIALGLWTDGCTAFGWNVRCENQGASRRQLLCQNWDWRTSVGKNLAIMSIERTDKIIYMVTEAGIVGKIGFNSKAVGICLNAIRAHPMLPTLLPVHVLLRIVLEADSRDAAITRLEDLGGCATGVHFLIADPSGSHGVELSPLGTCIIEEDRDGIVVHTNHFVRNTFVTEQPVADSPVRLKRVRDLCAEVTEECRVNPGVGVTFERLRRIFRDKTNPPGSICRHVDEGEEINESLFNIVMQLEEGNPRGEVVFGVGTEHEGEVLQLP